MTPTAAGPADVPDYAGLLALDGKAFVIAGAGQGIGRQSAHALASAGAKTLCVDVVAERAQLVADETDGRAFVGDMSDRGSVQEALDACVNAFGTIDGIVDIIGMSRFQTIDETDDDDWEWSQSFNLKPAFLLTQLGGRALSAHGGGSIVLMASVNGLDSSPNQAAYGASKAGIVSLMQTAAVEFGPTRVRVNAIAPGVVWTPRMSERIGEDERAFWDSNAPLGRVALPSDIASAVLFLSSDLASYITGQTIVVDGGTSRKYPYPIDRL